MGGGGGGDGILLIIVIDCVGDEEEVVSVNKSTLGLWSSSENNDAKDELDGGFPSLDGMLHWYVGFYFIL